MRHLTDKNSTDQHSIPLCVRSGVLLHSGAVLLFRAKRMPHRNGDHAFGDSRLLRVRRLREEPPTIHEQPEMLVLFLYF